MNQNRVEKIIATLRSRIEYSQIKEKIAEPEYKEFWKGKISAYSEAIGLVTGTIEEQCLEAKQSSKETEK